MKERLNGDKDCHFCSRSSVDQEKDLIELILQLWEKRVRILLGIGIGIVVGLGASRFQHVEWRSEAIIIPPLFKELQAQEVVQDKLAGMDIPIPMQSDSWFILFIQAWDSPALQTAWKKQSAFADKQISFMRQSSEGDKKRIFQGYHYEVLTLNASSAMDTRQALADYMQFVNRDVNKDVALRIKLLVSQRLAARGGETVLSAPVFPSFYVQPYRLQEEPSAVARSPRKTGLFALLGGILGGVVLSLSVVVGQAFSREIVSPKPAVLPGE
ncbi:Wzz/FepE/Etk N-terminal domain-containing protein [Enterobacter sp. DRP3]|nr:Wzz/FepE/Etk N-terminal domain-containing protein [Enterobacter sp. DRP3]